MSGWWREKGSPIAQLMAVSVLVGGSVGVSCAPPAHADIDDTEAAYIYTYGPSAVCPVIAAYPTEQGVLGVVEGIHEDGFTYPNAAEIVNTSVYRYCPEFWGLLVRIGEEARGERVGGRLV